MLIFRGKIGIMLGECHFQRIADRGETATRLVTEALMKAPRLQLLVVILPGKTPLYGRLFCTFVFVDELLLKVTSAKK